MYKLMTLVFKDKTAINNSVSVMLNGVNLKVNLHIFWSLDLICLHTDV